MLLFNGLLNAVISDNATVYCAIPFGHYMGDNIASLNINTCSDILLYIARPVNRPIYNQSIINQPFIVFRVV